MTIMGEVSVAGQAIKPFLADTKEVSYYPDFPAFARHNPILDMGACKTVPVILVFLLECQVSGSSVETMEECLGRTVEDGLCLPFRGRNNS
jgi:hypothetical protein